MHRHTIYGDTMAEHPISENGLRGVKKYFSIGDTIVREGDPSEGWYVLVSGKVGVFKRDLTITEIKDRGTIFGEVGCILNRPRTATLQALEPTSVLFVQMGIDELIAEHPDVTKKILLGLAESLAKTTESWAASSDKVK